MTTLLVDLGNSRLKWAYVRGDEHAPARVEALAHAELGDAALARAWSQPFERAHVASVAGAALTARVVAALKLAQPAAPVERIEHSPAAALGVRVAYAEPSRFGIDRFLALAAARSREAQRPLLVASLGTALAIDALAADGTHLGGLIAPSPEAMRRAVLGETARVEWRGDAIEAPPLFGRSTEAGLAAGTWHAAAALCDRAAAGLEALAGAPPRVFVAGGGGAALAPLLEAPHELAPHLVLEGLLHWSRRALG